MAKVNISKAMPWTVKGSLPPKFNPMAMNPRLGTKQSYTQAKAMSGEMQKNSMFGAPPRANKGRKMTQTQIAQRKRSTISNAASRTLGGLYSK